MLLLPLFRAESNKYPGTIQRMAVNSLSYLK